MARLSTTLFALLSLALFGQIKYEEEWHSQRVKINYGNPIGIDVFPYSPSRKEFYQAVEKGAEAAFTIRVMDEQGNPIEDAEAIGLMEKTSHRRKRGLT